MGILICVLVLLLYINYIVCILILHSDCYSMADAGSTRDCTQSRLLEICCNASVCAGAANKEEVPHYKFHIPYCSCIYIFKFN